MNKQRVLKSVFRKHTTSERHSKKKYLCNLKLNLKIQVMKKMMVESPQLNDREMVLFESKLEESHFKCMKTWKVRTKMSADELDAYLNGGYPLYSPKVK